MGKFSFGNLVGIWRQLGRRATKGRKGFGNCRLDKRLSPSGIDERLVPKDGGLDFVGKLVGYGGEEFEELLLAFLGATTRGFIDDAGVVGIVGDGEVVGGIVREEVDSNLVADVAAFGVGDEEH